VLGCLCERFGPDPAHQEHAQIDTSLPRVVEFEVSSTATSSGSHWPPTIIVHSPIFLCRRQDTCDQDSDSCSFAGLGRGGRMVVIYLERQTTISLLNTHLQLYTDADADADAVCISSFSRWVYIGFSLSYKRILFLRYLSARLALKSAQTST
jgi:hypothetical protein